jgi:hypothetical protein
LVFSNQKGAVTAEFMLLFPTVVLGLAGILGVFQLGLAQMELARNAFTQVRQLSINGAMLPMPESTFESSTEGQWVCVIARKRFVFDLQERACLYQHGK